MPASHFDDDGNFEKTSKLQPGNTNLALESERKQHKMHNALVSSESSYPTVVKLV